MSFSRAYHVCYVSVSLSVASTVLQALEETHAHLSLPAPLSPLARDDIGDDGALAKDDGDTADDAIATGPPLLRQPLKLRNAQVHLLRRLALLILRPSARELDGAKRFVAFFLFGTTEPQCLQPLVEVLPDGTAMTVAGGGAAEPASGGNGSSKPAAAAAAAAEISALLTPRFRRNSQATSSTTYAKLPQQQDEGAPV